MQNTDDREMGMVIVDLDGTMSDHSARYAEFAKDGDLEKFHSGFDQDPPTAHARHIWNFMERMPARDVFFFVSMRYEKHMTGTIKWMVEHISPHFQNFLVPQGSDPKKTFIMGNIKGEGLLQARMRQIRECFHRRAAEAKAQGMEKGSAILFEDNLQNSYSAAREFPKLAIFRPYSWRNPEGALWMHGSEIE